MDRATLFMQTLLESGIMARPMSYDDPLNDRIYLFIKDESPISKRLLKRKLRPLDSRTIDRVLLNLKREGVISITTWGGTRGRPAEIIRVLGPTTSLRAKNPSLDNVGTNQ